MRDNFYIYTDCEGNMSVLKWSEWKKNPSKSHRFYTRYVGNSPVECVPYPGQETVWDYLKSCYVPISDIKPNKRRS